MVSFISLPLVRTVPKGDNPRHSPRAFPLGLLAPRYLVCRFSSHSPPLRDGCSGGTLFGERKESFPQLRLVSAGLDQPAQPTPFLVSIRRCCGVAFATRVLWLRRTTALTLRHGRPSGNARGRIRRHCALGPPSQSACTKSPPLGIARGERRGPPLPERLTNLCERLI